MRSPKAAGVAFDLQHRVGQAEGAATWPQTVLTPAHLQTFIMMSHLAACSIKGGNYRLAPLQAAKPRVHILGKIKSSNCKRFKQLIGFFHPVICVQMILCNWMFNTEEHKVALEQ